MNKEQKSIGECTYCKKTFAKQGIYRHLKTHLQKKALDSKPGKSFLLKVEPNPDYWNKNVYFLALWIDGDTEMDDLDTFLRKIWLECCGHLSAFTDLNRRKLSRGGSMWDFFEAQELLEAGKTEEYEDLMEQAKGEIPMGRKIKNAVFNGMKIEYKYDFGSSTNLLITVMDEYPCKADEPIVILSRNEPLGVKCDICATHFAVEICTAHDWEEPSQFCEKCAKKHVKTCADFADYAAMPIVNSPRMGVCDYRGGTIDLKRDGALKVI
jgi:hypothetical protein